MGGWKSVSVRVCVFRHFVVRLVGRVWYGSLLAYIGGFCENAEEGGRVWFGCRTLLFM